MDKENAWEQFTKTGSVADYLSYANISSGSDTICKTQSGEYTNNADNNRCSGNPH